MATRTDRTAEHAAKIKEAGEYAEAAAYVLGVIDYYADPRGSLTDAERLAGIREVLAGQRAAYAAQRGEP